MNKEDGFDIFRFDKESDQSKNEMGLVLAFAVVGTALGFFALPIVLLTVILAYFLYRKFPLKVEWGLFLGFTLLFVLSIIEYGYQPLLQFGVIWKPLLPKVVLFFEKMIQNNQPFYLTNTSYLLGFLLTGTLTSLFLLLFRRLGKTWFTKEKEQQKTNYRESDSYKKFFKEKNKILEKEQEKYRQSNNKRIYLGMSVHKINEYLDIASLFTHCLIQGTTGSGKTTLMYSILEGALRDGLGSIFIDGKGDPKTKNDLQKLADAYGKKLIVFSDSSKYHYNPVKYGLATAIKERLMAVMDWSEQFYKKESENMLQMILNFLQEYIAIEATRTKEERTTGQGKRLKMDLETIHRFLDLNEIANYLFLEQSEEYIARTENAKEKKATGETLTQKDLPLDNSEDTVHGKYIRYFFKTDELTYNDLEVIQEMKGETVNLIRGLRTQLELLIYSDFGKKFQETGDPELDLDMLAEIKQGNIVLFSFSATNYGDFIQVLGRFATGDIAYCVSALHKSMEDEFAGALSLMDEAGKYLNIRLLDILSQARSAKLGAVIGIQSISDLVTDYQDLTGQIIDNVNLFFLGRTNYAPNAEMSAKTGGTYKDIDRTVMTENQGGKLIRTETKGERGTVRNVRKFWFEPDEVKDLPNYTFFINDKTRNALEPYKEQIFIRNTMAGL